MDKKRIEPCFALTKSCDKPCIAITATYAQIYKHNYCDKCRFYKTKSEFKKGIEKGKEI